MPGVLYDFNRQNLVAFEDNLKYKSYLSFVAYCSFETTAYSSGDSLLNLENCVVSCLSSRLKPG